MRVTCRLVFEHGTKAEAEKVARSLRVDDASYIRTTVQGRNLIAEAEAESFRSLIHTLEDYLACLAIAEKILRG